MHSAVAPIIGGVQICTNDGPLSAHEIPGSSTKAEQIAQRINKFLVITQMQMESVK